MIAIFLCRKTEQSRKMSRDFSFEIRTSSKIQRTRDIDDEHQRQFALFIVFLDMCFACARGERPRNCANVVARHVLAELRKSHTLPLKGRVVTSGQQRANKFSRRDLEQPNFFENLWRKRHLD